MTPLCSIIIPTYRQAPYIAQTIRSALAQDYENLEILVSDDCSGDGTEEIVKSFSDKRIRYVPNAVNMGRVANYHEALYHKARGKWVLNLDGDDLLIDSTFIRAAVTAAEAAAGTVLVFGDRFEMADPIPEQPQRADSCRLIPEYMDGTEYLLSWPKCKTRIHHLTCLYLRERALALDFYRADIISSDYESLFRLVIGAKIAHLPSRVAIWRSHGGNASTNQDSKKKIDNLRLFDLVHAEAVARLPASYGKRLERWLKQNVANKYYGYLLNAAAARNLGSLAEINAYMDERYPGLRKKVYLDPKTWFKGAISFARGKKR